MSAAGDLLERLSGLNETDREWILSRLSPVAKRRLLQTAQPEQVPPATAATQAPPVRSGEVPDEAATLVGQATAAAMREVLRGEPDWFVAAVLGAGDWSWRDEYLEHPCAVHLEFGKLPTLTVQMRRSVLQATAALLRECAPGQPPSRFESILQRLSASRSRRRWSVTT